MDEGGPSLRGRQCPKSAVGARRRPRTSSVGPRRGVWRGAVCSAVPRGLRTRPPGHALHPALSPPRPVWPESELTAPAAPGQTEVNAAAAISLRSSCVRPPRAFPSLGPRPHARAEGHLGGGAVLGRGSAHPPGLRPPRGPAGQGQRDQGGGVNAWAKARVLQGRRQGRAPRVTAAVRAALGHEPLSTAEPESGGCPARGRSSGRIWGLSA